jgi:hypothetical protein
LRKAAEAQAARAADANTAAEDARTASAAAAEALSASTETVVHHVNIVGRTLDAIDESDDAEHVDRLLSRGLAEGSAALDALAEQPFLTDPDHFLATLPQPGSTAEESNQFLTDVLLSPTDFAVEERRMAEAAGVEPGPAMRAELQLITYIVDARATQNVHVDYVNVSPDHLLAAASRLRRARSSPKGRKRKLRLLIRAFEVISGAAFVVVDAPVSAVLAGIISIPLGVGMAVDGASKILDELVPETD